MLYFILLSCSVVRLEILVASDFDKAARTAIYFLVDNIAMYLYDDQYIFLFCLNSHYIDKAVL